MRLSWLCLVYHKDASFQEAHLRHTLALDFCLVQTGTLICRSHGMFYLLYLSGLLREHSCEGIGKTTVNVSLMI